MSKYNLLTMQLKTEFTHNKIVLYYNKNNMNVIYNKVLSTYIFNNLKNIYTHIEIKNDLMDITDSIVFYIDDCFNCEQLMNLQNNNCILILNLVDQYMHDLTNYINYFSLIIISNKQLHQYIREKYDFVGECIYIPIPILTDYKINLTQKKIETDYNSLLTNNEINAQTIIYTPIHNNKIDIYFSNYILSICKFYKIKCLAYSCEQTNTFFGNQYKYLYQNIDNIQEIIDDDGKPNYDNDTVNTTIEFIINRYFEAIHFCSDLLNIILKVKTIQEKSKNSTCLYTAVFGSYDAFIDIKNNDKGIDYFYLTDKINNCSEHYNFIECPLIQNNFTISNRYYKILGHLFFKNYERYIFIDGNIEVISNNLSELCLNYTALNDIAVPRHPHYNSIVQELIIIIERNLYNQDKLTVINQLERYLNDNFPQTFPLTWNTVIFRKNTSIIRDLSYKWYSEFLKYCRRDQASFMYLIWKYTININIIELSKNILYHKLNTDGSIRVFNINNNFLRYEGH